MEDDVRLDAETSFSVVPHWLLLSHLSANAVRLYAVLASYTGRNSNECFPSQARLAKDMGVTKPTVKRALKELQDNGVVESVRRKSKSGDPTTNLYRLRFTPPKFFGGVGSPVTPGWGHTRPQGGVTDEPRTRSTGTRTIEEEPSATKKVNPSEVIAQLKRLVADKDLGSPIEGRPRAVS